MMQNFLMRFNRFWPRIVRWLDRGMILFWRVLDWVSLQIQRVQLPPIPLKPMQWLLLGYTALALAFMATTPLFEAGDEAEHYQRIVATATGEPLPQTPLNLRPPLYYALGAAVVSLVGGQDDDFNLEPNPYAHLDNPGAWGNKNRFMRAEPVPFLSGNALAVYLLRLAGVGLGAVTIWVSYHAGRLTGPHRPVTGLAVAGLVAFNPMFLFVTTSVTNLALAMPLNAAVMWLGLLTLRDGFAWRRSLLLGFLIGLAAWVSASIWLVVPVLLAAGLWAGQRTRDWRSAVIFGVCVGVVPIILAGPWLASNLAEYGDPFALGASLEAIAPRGLPFSVPQLLIDFQTFRLSFWGLFGAKNLVASPLLYSLLDLMVMVALFGTCFLVLQLLTIRDFSHARRELTAVLFVLGWMLMGMIVYVVLYLGLGQPLALVLFPFIVAVTAGLAIGLVEMLWWFLFILSPPERSFVRAEEAVSEPALQQTVVYGGWAMALLVLLIPFTVLAPAYTPPAPQEALSSGVRPAYANFGPVELVGYSLATQRYSPGEAVPVTLYWRAQERTPEDLMVSVAFVSPLGDETGKLDTYPGMGLLRTSTWQPGRIYADQAMVRISPLVEADFLLRLGITWWDRSNQRRLTPLNSEGDVMREVLLPAGALAGRTVLEPLNQFIVLPDEQARRAEFGEMIKLLGFWYDPAESRLQLYWEVMTNPDGRYTAFAHVYDSDGILIAQADTAPDLPTDFWRFGERYITTHVMATRVPFVTTPPELLGELTIEIGWYNADDLRLTLPPPEPEAELPTRFMLFSFAYDEEGRFQSEALSALQEAQQPETFGAPTPVATPTSEPVESPAVEQTPP